MKLRAFACNDKNAWDGLCGMIVFATDHSEAKQIFRDAIGKITDRPEWTDIECKLEPKADEFSINFPNGFIDWDSVIGQRAYRCLGWILNEASTCDSCGFFESDDLPESTLEETEDGWMECAECRAENKTSEQDHAMVTRDGYEVPLIGIPAEATLQECDLCHGGPFPIRELEFNGSQMLCEKCRKEIQ
jgi:hypothetical protein